MKFVYDAYERMINMLLDSGYWIADYHNYMQEQRPCIIRHDVDMSLEKAAKFSGFEMQMLGKKGIKSTYFVLVTSDFYNVFSKRSQQFLKVIQENGHEIGLHFDEKRYSDGDLKYHIIQETALLEKAIGGKVRVVSMHRPSQMTLESDINLDPIVNSYSKKFFCDFKYISDSRMHWREDVEEIVRSRKYSALHILTHPIWYGEKDKTVEECLVKFLKDAAIDRYSYLDENFRDLQEYVMKEAIL